MDQKKLADHYRIAWVILVLISVSGFSFAAGILWSKLAMANEPTPAPSSAPSKSKTVYPSKTKLDFEGAQIEGELRNPGDFYFEHRPEEKFDSLIKRRKNFHRQMLRDVVMGK